MRVATLALAAYIILVLFQPAYMHVADLFCNSCGSSINCSKQDRPGNSKIGCCEKYSQNQQFPFSHAGGTRASCGSCNPFLACSGCGFVFSSPLIQQPVPLADGAILLSADEHIFFLFIRDFLHPPECC